MITSKVEIVSNDNSYAVYIGGKLEGIVDDAVEIVEMLCEQVVWHDAFHLDEENFTPKFEDLEL